MIGNSTLLFMHLRLQEIYQTFSDPDGWFGGKTVVFFGDLCQLAPVGQLTTIQHSSAEAS